jgi:IclR family transcriptional regulator, acetate operon repressor
MTAPHPLPPNDATGTPTAAEKVLLVLLAFERRDRYGLHELATTLALPKSTVHRLLGTLKDFGLVHQDPRSGDYHLGARLWAMARRGPDHGELARRAQGILRDLVDGSGETAFLTVREGLHAYCIARIDTDNDVRLLIEVGSANPLHLGASNTVLLAFQPPDERRRILERTILQPTTREAVAETMERIAERGYAFSSEELTVGAAALGVPVFAPDGSIAAGLSIGAPAYRFPLERALAMLAPLQRAARALETLIGTPPAPPRGPH